MAADFGFIAHAAERDTNEFAAGGVADGHGERGLAHARRSDEAKAPSFASSDLRAWARPRSPCPSATPPAANSFVSRSAACAMKPKSAAIAALTSARYLARSSR